MQIADGVDSRRSRAGRRGIASQTLELAGEALTPNPEQIPPQPAGPRLGIFFGKFANKDISAPGPMLQALKCQSLKELAPSP